MLLCSNPSSTNVIPYNYKFCLDPGSLKLGNCCFEVGNIALSIFIIKWLRQERNYLAYLMVHDNCEDSVFSIHLSQRNFNLLLRWS